MDIDYRGVGLKSLRHDSLQSGTARKEDIPCSMCLAIFRVANLSTATFVKLSYRCFTICTSSLKPSR